MNPLYSTLQVGIIAAFLCIVFENCKKNDNPSSNANKNSATHLIAGKRLWHHSYILASGFFPGLDTTINYSDTTFTVHYINQETISIGSEILTYVSSSDSVLTFYRNNVGVGYDNVYYNYITNSILFSKITNNSSAAVESENYTTP